jgi:spoIIIJ-associated protein
MKKITMKGKTVEEAVKTAVEVLGGEREKAKVQVISEGKAGMLGMIGGEEAEVVVSMPEGQVEDSKQFTQEVMDKMGFLSMVEASQGENIVEMKIKGEDMGRIIGKEGATLKSLETIVSSAMSRIYGERVRVTIDADGYKEKREKALERLAGEVIEEVIKNKREKVMPPMSAADRRIIHLFIQNNNEVTSFSKGEGDDRRLVIAPKE